MRLCELSIYLSILRSRKLFCSSRKDNGVLRALPTLLDLLLQLPIVDGNTIEEHESFDAYVSVVVEGSAPLKGKKLARETFSGLGTN